jgi:regulator of protease activity HflC (stomatin/prohibitin superfamily)
MNIASIIQGAATLAWLGTVGLIILAVVNASRGRPIRRSSTLVIGMLAVAILLTVVGAGLVFLQPEERGVVISPYITGGYRSDVLGAGLHWIIPGESVRRYTISRQTYTMSIATDEGNVYGDDSVAARTSDGQEIYVDASVIYAIDPAKVIQVHIAWQNRYTEELVRPQARGIIRNEVAQYGVEEVITTQRAEMMAAITGELSDKLDDNGLILVDFILRNITFSPEYAASVEQKQIAEQQALQAQLVVEQRKQEAEQARQVAEGVADAAVIAAQGAADSRLIQAQAEAQALEMIAQVLQDNPDLLTYQYITKISPNVQVMFLPSDSPFLITLPDTLAPR